VTLWLVDGCSEQACVSFIFSFVDFPEEFLFKMQKSKEGRILHFLVELQYIYAPARSTHECNH